MVGHKPRDFELHCIGEECLISVIFSIQDKGDLTRMNQGASQIWDSSQLASLAPGAKHNYSSFALPSSHGLGSYTFLYESDDIKSCVHIVHLGGFGVVAIEKEVSTEPPAPLGVSVGKHIKKT